MTVFTEIYHKQLTNILPDVSVLKYVMDVLILPCKFYILSLFTSMYV